MNDGIDNHFDCILKFDGENFAQMKVTLNDTEPIAKIKVGLFTVLYFSNKIWPLLQGF